MDKKIIDLHCHSIFSDGSDTPEKLVKMALKKELSAIALTDHDTVRGVKTMTEAAAGTSLEVVPGVELSTFYKKHEIHIVGLFVDCENKTFLSALNQIRFLREERIRKMCAKLHMLGIDVDYDNLVEIYKSNMITRAHIADYLVNTGFISDRKEAFDKYIGAHCPAFVQWEKISAVHGVELIHSAGGTAILAHPVAYKMEDDELEDLIKCLKEKGLDGMEVFYSTNSTSFTDKTKNLAHKYSLLMSGGSDHHGRTKPLISLGTGMGGLRVPHALLEPIRSTAEDYKEILKNMPPEDDPVEEPGEFFFGLPEH